MSDKAIQDAEWAADKLAETLERIRLQLLAHVAAIAAALELARRTGIEPSAPPSRMTGHLPRS
jgi:hypothetical protein